MHHPNKVQCPVARVLPIDDEALDTIEFRRDNTQQRRVGIRSTTCRECLPSHSTAQPQPDSASALDGIP